MKGCYAKTNVRFEEGAIALVKLMRGTFLFKKAMLFVLAFAAMSLSATDYYVNTNGGVDDETEGRGLSPEMPYATISKALGKAKTSDDRVYVAEGTYLERNLTIAAGVGLIATGRRDYTSIDANASERDPARCINSMAAKAYVKGFTIKNGYRPHVNASENHGGGVKADRNAAIIDCAIRNCDGHRGGGGNGGVWIRCYFGKDNKAGFSPAASGVYGPGFVVNCVFDGSGCVVDNASYTTVVNCTFCNGGTVGANSPTVYHANVYNSLVQNVLGSNADPDKGGAAVYRSVAYMLESSSSYLAGSGDGSLFYPDVKANSPSIAWDADFMPLPTATDLVGKGNLSYYEYFPLDWREIGDWQKAYGGGPRMKDGAIDIGASEYSPEPARLLALSQTLAADGRVLVTAAAAEVSASADGKVVIPVGATIAFDWYYPVGGTTAAKFTYVVELADGAKLKLVESGEIIREIEKSGTYEIESLSSQRLVAEATGGEVRLFGLRNAGCLTVIDENGRMSISGAQVGRNDVLPGQSATATFSRTDREQPILTGVRVNGAFKSFVGDGEDVLQAVAVTEADDVTVEAVYEYAWYVDAENGDDSDRNDGKTPYSAKKTLVAAMALVKSGRGDVVHAAPGTYASGEVLTERLTTNRVEVASGCGLVADQGASVTIIEGAWATGDGANKGCGENAIRCVYLKAGAWIQGFTLRGGATVVSGTNRDNGGGVYGAADSCVTADCIIENCRAVRGGGVCGGSYVRCLMRENNAVGVARDAYDADGYYGCVFTSAPGPENIISVFGNIKKIVNCTFVGATLQGNTVWPNVYNSYISYDIGMCNYHHCVWRAKGSTSRSNYDEDCVKAVPAETGVDPVTYRPLATATALIDKGRNSYAAENWPAAWPNLTDFAGGQRIYNVTTDIGAGEFDWLPTFTDSLGGKRVAVVAASSGVTQGENGLLLSDGEALTVDWSAKCEGTQSLVTTVSGEGSLSVRLNGVSLPVENGVFTFEAAAGSVSRLMIQFEGAGLAEVLNFRDPASGMAILFR